MIQACTHVPGGCRCKEVSKNLDGSFAQRHLRISAVHNAKVVFLENGYTAWIQNRGCGLKHCKRIARVNQNMAANYGIDGPCRPMRENIAMNEA